MFRVTMQFGGKPVKKYTFDQDMISIGRDATCEICIENIGASRRHATIEKTSEGYVLSDLKSHNGTFVNGDKVFHHKLRDNDEFFIGKYCFVFESLEPVVVVGDDGADPPAGVSSQPVVPDMTFRLDRREIEKIIGHSTRGSAPQLVQLAPEKQKQTFVLDKCYYVVGSDASAEIKLSGLLAPAKAAVILRGDHGFRVVAISKRFQVNGRHTPDGPLQDGDLLQCGPRRWRFCQA